MVAAGTTQGRQGLSPAAFQAKSWWKPVFVRILSQFFRFLPEAGLEIARGSE
jgi:hypothetical protein